MKKPLENYELVKDRRLNNPDLKCDYCKSPIPVGNYAIELFDSETNEIIAHLCSEQCRDQYIKDGNENNGKTKSVAILLISTQEV